MAASYGATVGGQQQRARASADGAGTALVAMIAVFAVAVAWQSCHGGPSRPGAAMTVAGVTAASLAILAARRRGQGTQLEVAVPPRLRGSPKAAAAGSRDEASPSWLVDEGATWLNFCAELQRLDEARGAGGKLHEQGVEAAQAALQSVLRRVGEGHLPKYNASVWSPTAELDLHVADDARTQPGGRTKKTGEEHLTQLRELQPYSVLLLGDSHVERFPRMAHGAEAFAQLESRCGRSFAAGVGGDKVAHLAWRLLALRPLDLLTAPLRAVVVLIGSNDLLSPGPAGPFGGQPEAAAEATTALLRHLACHERARNATRLVLAIPPLLVDGADGDAPRAVARRRYNEKLRLLAPAAGATFFDFFAAAPETPAELFGPDGVHLSRTGYHRLAEGLAEALRCCGSEA